MAESGKIRADRRITSHSTGQGYRRRLTRCSMNKNNMKIVIDEFKNKVVPVLRQNGFTGSFPHFRKIKETQIDLLSILY